MPTIDIPHGRLAYRVAGPEDSAAPPVVFLHGVLVDASLWTGVAERLAAQGIRSCALDLPLGSHTEPLREGADRTPRGVARMVLDALEALELTDVTLVGNDTGGALCQLVLDTDASRIGRLVLTNCDAFEQFPPPALRAFIALCRRPGRLRALMRSAAWRPLRHSVLAYGGLVAHPLDPALSAAWTLPIRRDRRIAEDAAAVIAAFDSDELLAASTRLDRFAKPAVLVWGAEDRMFRTSLAERLRDVLPDARLVLVPDAKAFVPLDAPDQLAAEIAAVGARRAGQQAL